MEEIIKIITENKAPKAWLISAREKNVELEALVNGENFKQLLIKIEHKEDDEKAKARKRYSRSIKDLFERVLRPIDNVYSATGGNKNYGKDKKILDKIANVRDGKTLEKWLQSNWMKLYHTDPNGVIFYEWVKDDFSPTYKSIQKIRAYGFDGQKLKWILFEPEIKQGATLFRYVDNKFDYTIIQSGEKYTIQEQFINPFGECPGIIISDIVKLGTMERLTPIESIIEIAKEYLRDQSIKSIFKFLHGFPIFWRYAVQCQRCAGLGKTPEGECSDCDGLGYYMRKDITDAVTLPVPTSNEDVKLAPDIAGFITPPLDIWDKFTQELKLLELAMYETVWGSYVEKGANDTATGRWIDTQPVINRLNVYADESQWVEWYLTYIASKFYGKKTDEIVILYGRNYIIESPSTLLDRYEKAKEQSVTTSILDKLLEEWIYSKYKSDPERLSEELIRLKIEPFVHYSSEEVEKVFGSEKAKEKMLFSSFWINAEKEKKTKEQLLKEFQSFINQNK